jgi:hypothetical protein
VDSFSQPPSGFRPPSPNGPGRLLGAVFGLVFGGIGISVIVGIWSERGFHEPPLMFKMVGTFISIAFVAVGATAVLSAFRAGPSGAGNPMPPSTGSGGETGYTCPGCGARLGDDADVSPKGDVKCGYCKRWFNVHG